MSAFVTGALPVASAIPCARWTFGGLICGGFFPPCAPAWSGQRIPTGANVAQSAQIGRPQSEHERPVSWSGMPVAVAGFVGRHPD